MKDQIDWSKAPEGATRFHPETQFTSAHWWKPGQFCNVGFEQDGWQLHRKELHDQSKYIDRPAAWDGIGLPPLGCVCEHEPSTLGEADWQQVTILAHHSFDGETCAIWVYGNLVSWSPSELFRPLLLQETQAEEKAKKLYYAFFNAGSWVLTSENTRQIFRKAASNASAFTLAAPELLEALESLYEAYKKVCISEDWNLEVTRAVELAISSARGSS